ncbi:MAG: hypothetical protein L6R39_006714 [Caloplaca ligustica]|nr:MAG: hypothetical protein L6R39_006714 [Caloplaca ligustica]
MQITWKSSLALAAVTLLTSVNAHSWIENMSVIAKNGTFVGAPGYPRANAKRGPGVDPDKQMVHLLPPNGRPTGNKILDSDPMCMPSQQQPKQSDGSPVLKAAPGDMVALRYQENGHVSLPENQPGKPSNRGTIYIYGTTQPSPDDKFLSIHKVWNPDGTGGDKRGKLLATESFDDGQCYQLNGGPISTQRQTQFKHDSDPLMGKDLWCQNNFKIPQDAASGKPYTVYWVWDWDTAAGGAQPQGLQEKYTTCMDIDVSQTGNAQSHADSTVAQYAQGQNLNSAAIPQYVQKLNAGSDIYFPGSVPSGKAADAASSAAPPVSSPSAASQAPVLPGSQSSAPPAAGQATVTVTATPSSEKTVTVTAPGQVANTASALAANGPSTTQITTHSTVYVTPSTMQTQVAPTGAAGVLSAAAQSLASLATAVPNVPSSSAAPNPASSVSSAAAGPTPVTVSGVVIPTMSGNRFTGTASAVSPQQTTASPANPGTGSSSSGSSGNNKRCASCKPAKRSIILGGGTNSTSGHTVAHTQGRSLRHGSAKFRL